MSSAAVVIVPITTAADNILNYFLYFRRREIMNLQREIIKLPLCKTDYFPSYIGDMVNRIISLWSLIWLWIFFSEMS